MEQPGDERFDAGVADLELVRETLSRRADSRRGRTLLAAGILLVALVLVPAAFVVSVPTTFACRTFIDASAEAKLDYPGGRRLSYESREGARQLIELFSPQQPGFTAYLAVPAGDQGTFRWFDDRLQALGWGPLNPDSRVQVSQSSGETARGGAEMIALVRFDAGRIPPGISARPPDDHDLLRYAYFITDSASIPACR
jgi:hypothetical protein